MKRWIITIACLIVGALIAYYFAAQKTGTDIQGAFEIPGVPAIVSTILFAATGYLCMIAGVALGSLYRSLISKRAQGHSRSNWSVAVKEVWGSLDFQVGIVGSPLVFGLLWQGISDLGTAQFVVIAMQNGFTIHAILGRIAEGKGAAA